ncbi:MAG: hypothetical protein M1819_002710 [Sarea resinae]|nr:MAG: hypothetical protein M1819_002710 [Sarea resinae]
MSFTFGNPAGNPAFGAGANAPAGGNSQVATGPDLDEIQTEALGFLALAGESKVQLLSSPWPMNALPPPTSSLMSIASRNGLIAAAGPEDVVIASTDAVRQAFTSDATGDNNTKPFTPQLKLSLGMRISQVAFSADESFLVISAENGGGLAVYKVQSLMQNNTEPAFQLSTNGASLRALAPNPTPERAELFAIVTTNGELMMANLNEKIFIQSASGQVLKGGVSCISWSRLGKQLVAGLGDGTAYQMTPDGVGKASIPKPPALEGDFHVSSCIWLETSVFLVVHTPTNHDDGSAPETPMYLITTDKERKSFSYRKFVDPCLPFGVNRSPPHHFMLRLHEFPPSLQDAIIISSTVSSDIGLLTRAKAPLSNEKPAGELTDVFTTTGMADDSRRAQLPMSAGMEDTSAIGFALDLSPTEKVKQPIPGEEIDESPTPLPALMVLNNEGVLSSWWFIYKESIRQNQGYPGLTALGGGQQQQRPSASPLPNAVSQPPSTGFGQSSFGTPTPAASGSAFGGGFGKPSAPAFGSPSTPGAFGAPAGLGNRPSPWAAAPAAGAPAFGKPTFGSSTPFGAATPGTAFGQAGGLGNRSSPWAAMGSGASPSPGSAFGAPSTFGAKSASPSTTSAGNAPFGSTAPSTGAGGFGSYASAGGFAATASQAKPGESIFGKSSPGGSFSDGMGTGSSFGGTSASEVKSNPFAAGAGFTLGSTFKGDGTAKDDAPKPQNAGSSFFGSNFGSALGEAEKRPATPEVKEADMDEGSSDDDIKPSEDDQSTTPAYTPAAPKFQFPVTNPPATGGLFGTQSQSQDSPASVEVSKPAPFSFNKPSVVAPSEPSPKEPEKVAKLEETPAEPEEAPAEPKEAPAEPEKTPAEPEESPAQSVEAPSKPEEPPLPPATLPSSPKIKPEPRDDSSSGIGESIPSSPLSPDPTATKRSKLDEADNVSSEGVPDDAPLPPDFIAPKPVSEDKSQEQEPALPVPEEDEGLDDEGSGVDVSADISPPSSPEASSPEDTPKVPPGKQFGLPFDRSPVERISAAEPRQPQPSRSLFGEIGGTASSFFPPPSELQKSPRSPSPVRPPRMLSPTLKADSNLRSVSAPGVPTLAALPKRASKRPQRTEVEISKPRQTAEERRREEQERLAELRAKQLEEEEQELSDREDEKVREELATEVEATLTLPPFLAHQDYVGNVDKPGIPGQIERVYRDINSMIDTLGLNARSLKSFVKGHTKLYKDGGRSREDLESDEDWTLIEIEDLIAVEDGLADDLQNGRVQDVQEKLEICKSIHKDLARLRQKQNDIQRLLDARNDPEQIAALAYAPLSPEQASSQFDLRKSFQDFQKKIAGAEETLTLMKARLVSLQSENSRGASGHKPTVEAVVNTIVKMTSMIEEKSSNVDILEHELRKLHLASPSPQSSSRPPSSGSASRRSREGSPFVPVASTTALPRPQPMPPTPMGASHATRPRHRNPFAATSAAYAMSYAYPYSPSSSTNSTPRRSILRHGTSLRMARDPDQARIEEGWEKSMRESQRRPSMEQIDRRKNLLARKKQVGAILGSVLERTAGTNARVRDVVAD